jgi:hypothetical protein
VGRKGLWRPEILKQNLWDLWSPDLSLVKVQFAMSEAIPELRMHEILKQAITAKPAAKQLSEISPEEVQKVRVLWS